MHSRAPCTISPQASACLITCLNKRCYLSPCTSQACFLLHAWLSWGGCSILPFAVTLKPVEKAWPRALGSSGHSTPQEGAEPGNASKADSEPSLHPAAWELGAAGACSPKGSDLIAVPDSPCQQVTSSPLLASSLLVQGSNTAKASSFATNSLPPKGTSNIYQRFATEMCLNYFGDLLCNSAVKCKDLYHSLVSISLGKKWVLLRCDLVCLEADQLQTTLEVPLSLHQL